MKRIIQPILIAFALIIISANGFFLLNCDSSSSSSGSDYTADIDGLLEECNSIYTKYAVCTWGCDFGGLCIEGCVEAWYGDFLECCDQFDADTDCLVECLGEVETCYDGCDILEHDKRYDCFKDFTDCQAECPAPIAQDYPADEYEDRFGDEDS